MLYGKISLLLCEFNITSSDNRALRSAGSKLHNPQVHKNIACSFFAYRCTRLWNSLPEKVASSFLSNIIKQLH